MEHIKFLLFGISITALVAITCVRLGNWQYHKASVKQQLQAQLDQRLAAPAVPLPQSITQPEALRYLKVTVRGQYEAAQQFLLDNQVYQGEAGYYVITPLHIADSEQRVLVNRGWIKKQFSTNTPPQVAVPQGEQNLEGHLWLPPSKVYTLGQQQQAGVVAVRESLQMPQIQQQLAEPLLPLILRLQVAQPQSGLLVDWPRPDDRIATHLGYAYQWYGFALAAVGIFLLSCWRRRWQ